MLDERRAEAENQRQKRKRTEQKVRKIRKGTSLMSRSIAVSSIVISAQQRATLSALMQLLQDRLLTDLTAMMTKSNVLREEELSAMKRHRVHHQSNNASSQTIAAAVASVREIVRWKLVFYWIRPAGHSAVPFITPQPPLSLSLSFPCLYLDLWA